MRKRTTSRPDAAKQAILRTKVASLDARLAKTAAQCRQLKDQLSQASQRYRFLVDTMNEGLVIVDENIRMVLVNNRFCRMVGYSRKELIGRPGTILLDPDNRVIARRQFNIRKTTGVSKPYELVFTRKDGRRVTALVSPKSVFDSQGRFRNSISIVTDITRIKAAENALRSARDELETRVRERTAELQESEEKYRRLFNAESDAIYIIDGESYQILDANRSALDLYGYTRKEFLSKTALEVSAEPDLSSRSIGRMMKSEKVYVPLRWQRRKDGTKFPAEISASTLILKGRRIYCGIVRDISDRLRYEEQIKNHSRQLRELASELVLSEERQKRKLAVGLHDDVVQKLIMVGFNLSQLQRNLPAGPLRKTLEDAARLLDQALDSTRSLTFELCPPVLYDLGFVAAAQWLVDYMQGRYGLVVSFKDDGASKPLDSRLAVVLFGGLRELLINVAKHARAGRAAVRSERRGDTIRITVRDRGVGFDPNSKKFCPGQTGFGLFSIRERLSHLGGHMEMKSSAGQGTKVTLEVPVRQSLKGEFS